MLTAAAEAQVPTAAAAPDIRKAVWAEVGAGVNVSTEEMHSIVRAGQTLVLDTRPHLEWALGHISGARNVAPKPGMPMSLYTSDVAEVERLVEGDRSRPVVLYCNGPYCGKSKRVTADLLARGFSNVRLYQLGAPVWRALGGVMVIEPDGVRHVYGKDATAVWVDARDAALFGAGTVAGAKNIPAGGLSPAKDQGVLKDAKEDGRLPMHDHNTRIIVFGESAEQARTLAQGIAREAFHNVAYFPGSVAELQGLLRWTPRAGAEPNVRFGSGADLPTCSESGDK